MASGFGTSGTVGRCYPFWKDFSACVEDEGHPNKCNDFRADYLECLHHRKEYAREVRIAEERERVARGGARPAAPGHGSGGH